MSDDDVVTEAAVAPETGHSGPRRPWLIVAIVFAVLVVVLLVAVVINRGGSSSKTPTATLESAGAAGDNPFTDSFAVGTAATAFPKDVRAIVTRLRNQMPVSKQTQTRVATGTAAGVYGGNGATRACDPQALISYLQKNPGNAASWAKAVGIPRNNVSIFVNALTPVILMNDTRVTNHGYDAAAIAPRQSILQAGTAVMVDSTGTPRIGCDSGNPLTATRPIVITTTKGDEWAGFDPKAVTTVKPGAVTQALTLLNTQTGEYYRQPTGNGSAAPISVTGQWVIAEPNFVGAKLVSSTIFAISAGRPWTPVTTIRGEGVAGIAWGDGKWVAVTNANSGGAGNHVLVSTDLRTWKQVAALPNRLSSVAYGNGRWTATALHYTSGGPDAETKASGVIYTSTDAEHWTQVAETGGVANSRRQPVAYGNGQWLTVVGSNNASSGSPVPELVIYTSQDGEHWTPNGGVIRGQIGAALAFGPRTWAIGSSPATPGNAVIDTSTDGVSWTPSSTGLTPGGIAVIASGNTRWMAVVNGGPGRPVSTFFTSDDAETWTLAGTVDKPVSAFAFGAKTASDPNSPIITPVEGATGATGATGTTGASTTTGSAPSSSSTVGSTAPTTTASSVRAPQ